MTLRASYALRCCVGNDHEPLRHRAEVDVTGHCEERVLGRVIERFVQEQRDKFAAERKPGDTLIFWLDCKLT